MPIDFPRPATAPDFFQIYQQSFERGRERGRQRAMQSVLQRYGGDPDGAIAALSQIDPQAAEQLRGSRAEADGREIRNRQGTLDLKDHMRRGAVDHATMLVNVLRGLRLHHADPAERLAAAQHAAQQFPQFGLSPEEVASYDFSDAGIDRLIQSLTPFTGLGGAGGATAPAMPDGPSPLLDPLTGPAAAGGGR